MNTFRPERIVRDWASLLMLAGELSGERNDAIVYEYAKELKDRARRMGFCWGDDWAPSLPKPMDQALLLEVVKAYVERGVKW